MSEIRSKNLFYGAVKMISHSIYHDIPPQMKNLNMVITILMHFKLTTSAN